MTYSAPRPLAGFKGPTSKGREGKGREGNGETEEGGGAGGKRRGRGRETPSRIGNVKRWQPYCLHSIVE